MKSAPPYFGSPREVNFEDVDSMAEAVISVDGGLLCEPESAVMSGYLASWKDRRRCMCEGVGEKEVWLIWRFITSDVPLLLCQDGSFITRSDNRSSVLRGF